MFCLIALIILSILGIFSATHRELAKEALDCVLRRITFRPCTTSFDKRMKGRIVGKLLKKSPHLAKGVARFWEPLSWILVILFFVSLFVTVKSAYNLIRYKTCNPADPQSCILTQEKCSLSEHCDPCACGKEEENCQAPDYIPCGGEENCDCNEACEAPK